MDKKEIRLTKKDHRFVTWMRCDGCTAFWKNNECRESSPQLVSVGGYVRTLWPKVKNDG